METKKRKRELRTEEFKIRMANWLALVDLVDVICGRQGRAVLSEKPGGVLQKVLELNPGNYTDYLTVILS